MTVYAEIGHMSAKLILETRAKTVGMVSFVKVAFICLKFRVGIVEPCQEVRSLSNVPSRNGGALKADIAMDRCHC